MHRKLKKSETLEVRLAHKAKQAFMTKAADDGQSASEVVRTLVAHYMAGSSLSSDRSPVELQPAGWPGLDAVFQIMILLTAGMASAWALALADLKPLFPSRIGLWRIPDPSDPLSFSVGFMNAPPGAQDLVGWWIIPIGLLVALSAGYVGWSAGAAALRLIRRCRTTRPAR